LTEPSRSSRQWGSRNYVGEVLEGTDELPVLAHPELVGFHGAGGGLNRAGAGGVECWLAIGDEREEIGWGFLLTADRYVSLATRLTDS
jgi:hypothetical protein